MKFMTIRQLIDSRAPGKPPPSRRGRKPGSVPGRVLFCLRATGGATLSQVARHLRRDREYAALVLSEMVRAGAARLDGELYREA